MKQPLLLAMVTLAFSTFAGAATYKIKLLDSIAINGRELKPGDYKLEVNDMTAVIRNGRDSIEVKVKIETKGRKYDSTAVRYSQEGGKNNLQEIHIGGTKTNLIFGL